MLPISLRPHGRRAVIAGGGNVATRKAEALLHAEFSLFVVAPRIDDRLRSILSERGARYEQRCYETGDLEGVVLVVAATDDPQLNARIVDDARMARVLVCDATEPERGDFTMPAVANVGALRIAVESGGEAPAFSRRVAREIAESLGAPYAAAVGALAAMRRYVKATFSQEERAGILRALAQRPIEELAAMPIEAVCATRRSALAMIQSRSVAARLAERGIATTMLGVVTAGDRDRQTPIDRLGSVSVFVKELESALREERADYAVHSCKDLPGGLPDDMRLAAVSSREDPRDAFCSERYADFESLPAGAVVGTSSNRRRAQLAAIRADVRYEPLRGNVDTRLRKLARGEYDAIVLAMAGLKRLGVAAKYTVPFPVDRIVPAAGQGALAIETRAGDERLIETLRAAVNDPSAELCVVCERAALRELRAGCSAPLGVHASFHEGVVTASAVYVSDAAPKRIRLARNVTTLEQAEALGSELASSLQIFETSKSGVAS
jgi:hydroxymethylbilane synthase